MRYDDEMLEQALAALPLEETPPDLHASILAATTHRPAPIFRVWELWVVGFALATASWLVLAIAGSPLAGGGSVAAAIQTGSDRIFQLVILAWQPSSVLWLGIGVIAAVWFSQLSFPSQGGGEGIEA
jgi:hypothetical protein